jgi:hypothetical protein
VLPVVRFFVFFVLKNVTIYSWEDPCQTFVDRVVAIPTRQPIVDALRQVHRQFAVSAYAPMPILTNTRATMDLYGTINDGRCQSGYGHLDTRYQLSRFLGTVAIHGMGTLKGEESGHVQIGHRIGNVTLHGSMLPQVLAKGLSFQASLQHEFKTTLGCTIIQHDKMNQRIIN